MIGRIAVAALFALIIAASVGADAQVFIIIDSGALNGTYGADQASIQRLTESGECLATRSGPYQAGAISLRYEDIAGQAHVFTKMQFRSFCGLLYTYVKDVENGVMSSNTGKIR